MKKKKRGKKSTFIFPQTHNVNRQQESLSLIFHIVSFLFSYLFIFSTISNHGLVEIKRQNWESNGVHIGSS